MSERIDKLLAIVGTAIFVHLVFNRYEPRRPYIIVSLLAGVPALLVALLHRNFPTVAKAALFVYPAFIVSLISSVILYRLSPFHPLYKFPGPIINRISGWKMVHVAIGGKRHLYMKALHEKYGPYVRLGPNSISAVDANIILPVLGAKGWPRGSTYSSTKPEGAPNSMAQETEVGRHAERRKTWNPAFTHEALKEYDDIIIKRTRQLIDALGQFTGIVDLGKWIAYYNFDFMGDLVFGGGFEMMREGKDAGGYWKYVIEGSRVSAFAIHISWIGNFLPWLPVWQQSSQLRDFAARQGDIRRRRGPTVKDLFYHFAREDHPDSTPPNPNELVLAIVGGADTTSTATANVLYFLLTHPHVYKKIMEELDSAEDVASHDQVANLPYLDACIKETLRVLPPVTSTLNRTPPKGSGGVVIGAHYVPEGTDVYIPPYCFHHDSRYFTLPDTFWPERWLISKSIQPGDKPNELVHNEDAYIPFSFGPANCVGKQLAYREMRMVIGSLLKEFDVRLADGYKPEQYYSDLRDDGILVKGELPVILVKKTG